MEQYSDEKRQRMLYSINFDLVNHEDVVLDANALNVALDSPIFRIYDYQRFLELLKDGRNVLVRPSCWEDPFDNMLYNVQYYKQINGHRYSIDVSKVRDQWYNVGRIGKRSVMVFGGCIVIIGKSVVLE